MRQIIPTSRSISAKTPAYATAINIAGADSERRATGVGLAPFLVPSRRPRPVIRSRGEIFREIEFALGKFVTVQLLAEDNCIKLSVN